MAERELYEKMGAALSANTPGRAVPVGAAVDLSAFRDAALLILAVVDVLTDGNSSRSVVASAFMSLDNELRFHMPMHLQDYGEYAEALLDALYAED